MKSLFGIIFYAIFNLLSFVIKKNEKNIIFGAWVGEEYLDNTKYLFEYMGQNKLEYKLIWIGKKNVLEKVGRFKNSTVCRRDSVKAIYYILTSKYVIVSHSLTDISKLPMFKYNTKILTDHGIPIKKWMDDDQRYTSGLMPKIGFLRERYKQLIKAQSEFDYFISASEYNDKCILSAEKSIGAKEYKLVKSGTPRNDFLINLKQEDIFKLKLKYSKLLNFDVDKKVIFYAPTFRRTNSKIESIIDNKDKIINLLLKNNAIFLEKSHFATFKSCKNNILSTETIKIIDESNKVNIQEILAFTDILISDYSGVYLDFTLLDRPIINFLFDYDYYKDIDSGLYYTKEVFTAGKITTTFEEVVNEIEYLLEFGDLYNKKREEIKNTFLKYETGNASEKICTHIFEKTK